MIFPTPANPKWVTCAVDEMGWRSIDWYVADLQFNGTGEDFRCLREVCKALEKCATPRSECFVSALLFMAGLISGDNVGGRGAELSESFSKFEIDRVNCQYIEERNNLTRINFFLSVGIDRTIYSIPAER
jgi:hypothetical protein